MHRSLFQLCLRGFCCALLLCLASPAGSATSEGTDAAMSEAPLQEADGELKEMERALRSEPAPGREALRDFLGRIPAVRETAQRCVTENESRLDKLRRNLETLGAASPQEVTGVQEQRRNLQRRVKATEQQLQFCRVLMLRSNQLQDRITRLQQERLTERLSRREDPAWQVIADNLRQPDQLWTTARLFLLRESGLGMLSLVEFVGLLGLALVGIGGSLYARAPMFAMAERRPATNTVTAGFVRSVLACAANILPALVTSVAVALYLTVVGETGWAFITVLSYGLAGYFVFVFTVRVFLAPCPPAHAYLPAPEPVLRSLARRLRVLAMIVLAVSLFSATLVVESFPEPVRDLLRLVIATVLIVNLMRIIWLAGDLLRWHDTRLPRLILSAGMLLALVAEWSGYLELSEYIVGGIVGTLLAFAAAWFVWRLFDDLFDGLDEGRRGWHRTVRETLGVGPGEYMPGLIWLRILVALMVWAGFGLLVLLTWGLSDTGLAWLARQLNEGVNVGRFEIVPIQVVWGLVALVVAIAVSGWFKQRLGQRWLSRTRMERGAREAVVTVSGYVGIGLAVLIGLAVAGVEFTNLALIAGALSVGLGFGLQNIFNNFVSGLILLFERPIKTDDWVVVGTTEGFVKRISIRATQIQTFDRADVIVPNSELIQSQVTNWMLRDPFGRVIVPVRVAYGSDPEAVRDLLLRIAHDHPRVINDALLAPVPEALFRRLGEFAMEFELRAFIRDIEYFLNVVNDLNFAIEREFRAHGIEIPYPRQDVRLGRLPDRPAPDDDADRLPPAGPSAGGAPGDTGGSGDG